MSTPAALLACHDAAALWPADWAGEWNAAPDPVAHAYAQALAVRALRLARGEQPAGFKIGFTNRGIWPRYQVYGPIWGTVWAGGLQRVDEPAPGGTVHPWSAHGLCQPRIEPECAFRFARTPPPEPTLADLVASLDGVAPAFEIVQSHRPGWLFTAADTIADSGLHGRLLVGRFRPLAGLGASPEAMADTLARATAVLWKDGVPVDEGSGRFVLDSPLLALLDFVQMLRATAGAPDLQPGDVVTTGTWTDAWPVAAGDTWRVAFGGVLPDLAVRLEA